MKARILLVAVAIAISVLAVAGWTVIQNQYTFANGTRVWVEGTSSVHDWSCAAGRINGSLSGEPGTGALSAINGINVTIPVASLDCENSTMNGKLREALRASANPNITFTLSNARVSALSNGRFPIQATGSLRMAGTTRTMNISASGQALSNGRFRVTGSVPFAMSTFGIDPPTALLGTLRTGDNVTVRFDVTLQP